VVQTTGNRIVARAVSPDRGVGSKITFVKFHAAAAKQFQILFAKRSRPVMLRLLFDITANGFALGGTYVNAP